MDRTILHCDCNGFYASVECILKPELKKVPMAVGGDAESRHGIVLAKNELAKKYGIQTAETIWQAKRKCPNLLIVRPHRDEYIKYSEIVNKIYEEYTDQVEPFGIDESWLDVTGSRELFGNGKQIADTIRNRIREEVGLTISVGVSFNKIFAKLGSDYKKPDATTVIDRENYKKIIYPLNVSALLFVGHSAEETLKSMGIHTIGELAAFDTAELQKKLGKAGEMLSRYSRGEDYSPVASAYAKREIKSIGNGTTFKRNLVSEEDIQTGVAALSDVVAVRMRKHHVKCMTVQVIIKDTDLKTISRQKTLLSPTNLAKELEETVMEIIKANWKQGRPIRMITIQGANLVGENDGAKQISLFGEEDGLHDKREKLEAALDKIREKFGKGAVTTASVLKNDIGVGAEAWKKEEE